MRVFYKILLEPTIAQCNSNTNVSEDDFVTILGVFSDVSVL